MELKSFISYGLTKSNLLPVTNIMYAGNEGINIVRANFCPTVAQCFYACMYVSMHEIPDDNKQKNIRTEAFQYRTFKLIT